MAGEFSRDRGVEASAVRRAPRIAWWRELRLVTIGALVYYGTRALTVHSRVAAFRNAHRVMRFEDHLGISFEHAIQAPIRHHHMLELLANWMYIYGHLPLIAGCAILLYRTRPEHYRRLRNAVFLSGAVGIVIFLSFPVAPPRLADPHLLDTVTLYSHGYRVLQPPRLTDRYAAVPSLHFGWNLLVAISLFRAFPVWPVRAAAVLMATAMGFAVIATANHYILDVLVATVLVLTAYAVGNRAETGARAGWRALEDGARRTAHRPSPRTADEQEHRQRAL